MPNWNKRLVLAPTTAQVTVTASDVPGTITQAWVSNEGTTPIRILGTGTAASTGASGGLKMAPGDSHFFGGNDYGELIKRLSAVALTDGGTASIGLDLFDGYDRA